MRDFFGARFIWVSREIWVRAARGLGRGRGRESEGFSSLLRLGEAKSHWLKNDMHQSIFAANVEKCWIAFLEVGNVWKEWFGCETREDWGGGEVRILISTPETKFHRKFKTWQELVNQTAQAVGNQHGRQAFGCLYFGSFEEISGHSKRSVPTERTASYISEKFALKLWRTCRTSHRIRKKV